MIERRRPSKTVVCPSAEETSFIALLLISQKHTFTVEASPTKPGVFYVGVLADGEELIARHYSLREAGLLGDVEPGIGDPVG